jgi:hypothetical protein
LAGTAYVFFMSLMMMVMMVMVAVTRAEGKS